MYELVAILLNGLSFTVTFMMIHYTFMKCEKFDNFDFEKFRTLKISDTKNFGRF